MLKSYRLHSGQFSINFHELEFKGTDVASFLQKQSTFDVLSLSHHHFQLISFLDPQGRIETYGWILKNVNKYIFLCPLKLIDSTIERLEKFLISEDVEIHNHGLQSWFFLIGPKSSMQKVEDSFQGNCFEEAALVSRTKFQSTPEININEREQWRKLNGWPSFDG